MMPAHTNLLGLGAVVGAASADCPGTVASRIQRTVGDWIRWGVRCASDAVVVMAPRSRRRRRSGNPKRDHSRRARPESGRRSPRQPGDDRARPTYRPSARRTRRHRRAGDPAPGRRGARPARRSATWPTATAACWRCGSGTRCCSPSKGPEDEILVMRARPHATVPPDWADRAYRVVNEWNHTRRFCKAYVGDPTERGQLPIYAEMQVPLRRRRPRRAAGRDARLRRGGRHHASSTGCTTRARCSDAAAAAGRVSRRWPGRPSMLTMK